MATRWNAWNAGSSNKSSSGISSWQESLSKLKPKIGGAVTSGSNTYKPPTQTKTYTPPQPTPQPTYESPSGSSSNVSSLQDWMSMIQGMMPQSSNISMPTAPQQPVVTSEMIAEWQARAKEEAGLTYDPQILSIQQQLDQAVLAAQQAKGAIAPSYQDALDNIVKWQQETLKAEQGRAYARGFGQGGGLISTESDIAKEALGKQTSTLTEKARKESDIEAQIQQLKTQAGEKTTQAESAKASYITTRAADLQDTYVAQKTQLDQQAFANQMQIAEFGLTQESQTFSNWLSSMSAAVDIWYSQQQIALEQEAQSLNSKAATEALNWEKTKYYDSVARAAAGGSSTNKYENMTPITLNGKTYYVTPLQAWQMQQETNSANKPKPSGNLVGSNAYNQSKTTDKLAAWIAQKNLEIQAAALGYYPGLPNGTVNSNGLWYGVGANPQ